MNSSPSYWKVSFCISNPDEFAHLLFEKGAAGVQVIDPDSVICFIEGTEKEIESFIAETQALNFQCRGQEEVLQENWVQRCEDIWTPIQLNKLRIVPLIGEAGGAKKNPRAGDIYVVPGEGFGTGHHASTRLAISLLEKLAGQSQIKSALDVGTGSGILAIAANKLFSCSVLAVDIDKCALDNAGENIALNEARRDIELRLGGIDKAEGKFNLIVANIYAEVLCNLQADFTRCLLPGGYLILSGIMHSLSASIERIYSRQPWVQLDRLDQDGWTAYLFHCA